MAFTFSQTNEGNTAETYNLEITIDPTAALFTDEVLEVGDEIAGTIEVTNSGDVDAQVYLTSDWGPGSGTSDREATLLANALQVSVFVSADPDPTLEYSGSFIGLIDQEVISNLESTEDTEVYISVVVPDNRTGPTLLDKSVSFDFVFVAISVE